jgi:hypothetical protein
MGLNRLISLIYPFEKAHSAANRLENLLPTRHESYICISIFRFFLEKLKTSQMSIQSFFQKLSSAELTDENLNRMLQKAEKCLAFHGDVLAAPPGVFEKQATDG